MINYRPGDPRLLFQDEIWVAKDGRQIRLTDMDSSHRINLLGFLRRRAVHLQKAAYYHHCMFGLGSVEDPSDGVWAAQVEAEHEFFRSPEEWVELQPLVIKLREWVDATTATERARNTFLNRTFKVRRRVGLGRFGTSG